MSTISVVLAARNAEQTIQDAVHSALIQTSPAEEVIVVDDMSADRTKQRVLELRSERVLLLDGEGRGVSAARNAGIRSASGTWIAFLDGDDRWEPEFLELAQRRIRASPDAVACFGAATPIDDSGRPVGRHEMRDVVTLEDLVCGRVVPTTSATLVRRNAVIGASGFFEGFRCLAGVEDLDLWWRIASTGRCVGVLRASVVYVVHDHRDRNRPVAALLDLERDREMAVDRLAATGAPPALVRRGRAIMRARTARYWLRADKTAYARASARSSLQALPTLEGFVTFLVASSPTTLRRPVIHLRRRRRASGRLGGM